MHKIVLVLLVSIGLVSGQQVFAAGGIDNLKDGTAGAQLGTNIYNTFINPDDPLPMPTSDGALIENTLYNIGENLTKTGHINFGEAFGKAEMDVSGVTKIKPAKSPLIPNGGGLGTSKSSPTCNCDIAH